MQLDHSLTLENSLSINNSSPWGTAFHHLNPLTSADRSFGLTSASVSSPRPREIAFVDANVTDYQELVAGFRPEIEIHILNPLQDGVVQIEQHLATYNGSISGLHLISHGASGELQLGKTGLNLDDLSHYSRHLQSWSEALTPDADILLYGCNVAAGATGTEFVQRFAQLTKADIAASNDLTGSTRLAGNWQLEVSTGEITVLSAVTPEATQSYQNVLDDAAFAWAKSMGGNIGGSGQAIAADNLGNVYSVGNFQGTGDFDPGSGTFNLTDTGHGDVFVSKLDTNGNFVWAKRLGGSGVDSGNSIFVDDSGNVYITGSFQETADFDPGSGTFNLTSSGVQDIFVAKLDTNGNFVWAKRLGGHNSEESYDIAVDGSGHVYTTGSFRATVDFDPGNDVFNLTSNGAEDAFVSKLDINGNFVWAKSFGGDTVSNDIAYDICVDTVGNVYTTGLFYGTIDFDPSSINTFNLTNDGATPGFISKLDTNGNFLWAKNTAAYINDVLVDKLGNIYTTGYFGGIVDFDLGQGTFNLTSAGLGDIFISKLDISGGFVWARRLGGSANDEALSISVDHAGNVYTTGFFSGTVNYANPSHTPTPADFNPGIGTFNLTNTGYSDAFISKLNADGNFVWAKRMGGKTSAGNRCIYVDREGNVYATGFYSDTTLDFDPGSGTFYLSQGNAFVLKLTPKPTVNSDFNGDGQTDLVWRNNGTSGTDAGKVSIWTMNSSTPVENFELPFKVTDVNWRIEGTGDFNDDGQVDLVWRYYGTTGSDVGKVSIWTMNGVNPVQTVVMPFLVPDVNWKIEGIADFDRDNKLDLVWRNYGTTGTDAGKIAIWTMNGTNPVRTIYMPFVVSDVNWKIDGVADFNNDGDTDLLWRHYGTSGTEAGKVVIWTMDGVNPVQTVEMPFKVTDTNWRIEGVGDFNGDQKADLVWRHYGTTGAEAGKVVIWTMDGVNPVQTVEIPFRVTDPYWQIVL
jgi:hypothetical protein